MRILLLAQWYDPVIGGEERHVQTLARKLADRGHDVSVATMAHPDAPSFELDGNVRVHRLKGTVQKLPFLFASAARQSSPPAPDPGLLGGLRRIVEREAPEVVHAHNWMAYSYLPLGDKARPLIMTLHDYSLVCAKKNMLYRGAVCDGPAPSKCLRCAARHYGTAKGIVTVGGLWGVRPSLLRSVSRFITVSRAVAIGNRLDRLGVPHEVIPNFLPDGPAEAPATEEGPLSKGVDLPAEPFILYVGSFSRIKGVPELIRAYREMTVGSPLVLIGYRGSERLPELETLPPGVQLLADQPPEVVSEAWSRAICGVVPSIWQEPAATVALEAMAAGRPVVASRVGGLPEVIADGVTGLLVDPGDTGALAAAMARVVRDPQLGERLGAAARATAADYRASAVVPRIEALYAREIERTRLRRAQSSGAP